MKANELMIGDWVAYRRDFPDMVTGISRDGLSVCLAKDGWISVIDVLPIPLTPEILEKNGFVARYAYGQKKWHIDIYNDFHRKFDDNGDITLNVYSERKMEWRLSIDTGRNERTVIYIRFVHELQHALRLCGIEKEVVL